MKKRTDHTDIDPFEPDETDAPVAPVEGASDSTLLILLGSVIALLLVCIIFGLVAS